MGVGGTVAVGEGVLAPVGVFVTGGVLVGDTLGVCVAVGVTDGLVVGEGEAVPVPVGVNEGVGVTLGVPLGVPLPLGVTLREGVAEGVPDPEREDEQVTVGEFVPLPVGDGMGVLGEDDEGVCEEVGVAVPMTVRASCMAQKTIMSFEDICGVNK